LELCAVFGHVSPMALYRLVCALGYRSLVAVLTRCGLPLPTIFWPMRNTATVSPRKCSCPRLSVAGWSGIWATPRRRVRRPLRNHIKSSNVQRASRNPHIGFVGCSLMALTAPRRVCEPCFRRHVSASACGTRSSSSQRNSQPSPPRSVGPCAPSFTLCSIEHASEGACACLRWASAYATLPITSPTQRGRRRACWDAARGAGGVSTVFLALLSVSSRIAGHRDASADVRGRVLRTRQRPLTVPAAQTDAPGGGIRHIGPLTARGADRGRVCDHGI